MDLQEYFRDHNGSYTGPKVEDHFPSIFRSYEHVVILLVAYLSWTTLMGPKFMHNRKPFQLKEILMVYNMLQVLINGYLCYWTFMIWGWGPLKIWNHVCAPLEGTVGFDNHIQTEFFKILFYYYITKIADILDTVFFVLRKKQSQVTFLHLFHHTTMVSVTWLSLVHLREQILAVFGILNMIIHVFMYSYYFLSAFGEKMQKYLWWKKHLTKMQMIQFLIMLTALARMKIIKCKCHPLFWTIWSVNIFMYFILFLRFYILSYKNKNRSEKKIE